MTPEALLTGIKLADRHGGGLRCLHLLEVVPEYFTQLSNEVREVVATGTGSDVAEAGHVTHWVRPVGSVAQYSLLNRSGRLDDFSEDHDLRSDGKRFHLASRFDHLARLIAAFPGSLNFRVNVLAPGAGLSPHEENAIVRTPSGRVAACVRFHLAIATNPDAEILLDGFVYHLPPAVVTFVNHGTVHAAWNRGSEDRVHLVWDALLDGSTFERAFGPGTSEPAILRQLHPHARVPAVRRKERPLHYQSLTPVVHPAEAAKLQLLES
jgi:hypothetical protein